MIKKTEASFTKLQLTMAIQELLQKGKVTTQEEIRENLHKQGIIVNQTRISRTLHKLGAIKITEGNQIVYRLPAESVMISPRDSVKQMVLSIIHNETLIVIRTSPGSAQLVANLLDNQKKIGILGTVAGDDTIFIAPENLKEIQALTEKISALLFS